jgi:hypothetical protein
MLGDAGTSAVLAAQDHVAQPVGLTVLFAVPRLSGAGAANLP